MAEEGGGQMPSFFLPSLTLPSPHNLPPLLVCPANKVVTYNGAALFFNQI